MAIDVTPIQYRYRYNGAELPYLPGYSAEMMRDLYSATYTGLIGAEIVYGDIADGVQEVRFEPAVTVKG